MKETKTKLMKLDNEMQSWCDDGLKKLGRYLAKRNNFVTYLKASEGTNNERV